MTEERRKKQRPQPYVVMTEAERDAYKALLHSVFDERGFPKKEWFGDMKPEEHIADHLYVGPRRRFWERLTTTAVGGAWGGLRRVIEVIVAVLGAIALFSMVGSLLSPGLRHWIASLLLGG